MKAIFKFILDNIQDVLALGIGSNLLFIALTGSVLTKSIWRRFLLIFATGAIIYFLILYIMTIIINYNNALKNQEYRIHKEQRKEFERKFKEDCKHFH
jgi:hypothetical protein